MRSEIQDDDQLQIPNPQPHSPLVIGHWSSIILGLLLRLAPLGRYVTPDEPAWVYRSIRFADALAAGEWAAVPSTGHPGVTTMWLGTLGVAVCRLLKPAESVAHLDWIRRLAWLAPENGEAFRHLAFFLPHGRVAVALVTTLGLVVLYPLLARLFDRRVALLTVGLLAFDPFLIGHSGLLHTDALLATFSSLSILCLLSAARNGRRSWAWSLASGAMAGLALLTKSLAVFLLPFAGVILGSAWLLRRMRLSKALGLSLLWALACLALFLAPYPAMWGAPLQTLRDLFGAPAYQSTTALMPTFFAGRTALRHGPEFYAVALPFRLSPIVLVGLILSLRTFWREKSLRSDLAWLWLFALGYVFFLALSVKKYDRYLLPTFPPLTLAAALGIGTLVDWYTGKLVKAVNCQSTDLPLSQSTNLPIYQYTILLFQALIALAFALYPLTYANPLVGGPWVAARVLPVDWGEGMGAAARWLNQLPDAEQLTVAALSVPSFAPLFYGHTVPLDRASLSDYIVTTASNYQFTHLPISQFTHLPMYQFTIYTNTAPFEQAAYLAAHAEPDDLILLDADTPLLRQYGGPGTLVSVTDLAHQAAVAHRLVELSADHSTIWLVADPAASPITAAHLRQGLECIATPVATATVASATISQFAIRNSQFAIRDSQFAAFGDQLTLIAALLPAAPVNTSFSVFLRWQVPAPTPTDLHASLYLRDPADHLWAEVGQLVLNDVTFPTSAWDPSEWADNTLTLKLPQRIPPGTYAVQLTVTDAEGAQLGAWDADGQFRGVRVSLGDVEITPPAEPIGLPPCTEGYTLAAGRLLACVPDLPPQAIPSGDVLTLALTWSATTPPRPGGDGEGADYRVRWRLLDAAGSVALEQIADLSPYAASRWRAGDSFEARYDLRFDPALPAGIYTLAFNVLAPEGHLLWAEDENLTTVEVLPRERSFELPADIAHPLDLTLGDVIHLRGFDLTPLLVGEGTGEGFFQPGDTLILTLYWQADGPTDLDYTVFAHLVGPDGRPHGQVDSPPAGGAAPTTSWARGQVIVDEMALLVAADAPAGTYHIAVGMYDATSGNRLPITDAAGQPLPHDQAILPVAITLGPDGRCWSFRAIGVHGHYRRPTFDKKGSLCHNTPALFVPSDRAT